jgi:tRNA G18 (ribose-2'-O)-methylase SpoU
MRGYFAIGAEGISKAANLGNLVRSAHAFGASFAFTIGAAVDPRELRVSDTSDAGGEAGGHLPLYSYPDVGSLVLPDGCTLVGIELLDESIPLPSFRHPLRAAYVVGPERGSLSPALLGRCDFVVRIPARFCINVGVAGALVMYDRMISLGRFAERPVRVGGPTGPAPRHVHGRQKIRNRRAAAEPDV